MRDGYGFNEGEMRFIMAWPGRGVRARRSEGNVNCRNLGPGPWLRRTWSKIFTVGHPHP